MKVVEKRPTPQLMMIGNKWSLLYFATSNESIYLVGYGYSMWLKLEMLHTMLRVKTNENRNGWNHQPGKLHASQNGKTPYSSKPRTNIPKNHAQFQFDKKYFEQLESLNLSWQNTTAQSKYISSQYPNPKTNPLSSSRSFWHLFAGGPRPMQIRTAVKLLEVPKKRSMTLTKGKRKAKREAPL